MSEKRITLSNVFVSDTKIICEVTISDNIKKYFVEDKFEIDYGQSLENVDESILSIPPLSSLVSIAWTIGANIYLEIIDETYLHSLRKIQSIFKKWIPQFSFSTNIYPTMIKKNVLKGKGSCLLFSGGVDSLSSYLRHKEEKPMLISIFGHYTPLYESEPIQKYEQWLQSFADSEGVDYRIVTTTFNEILNLKLLNNEYGRSWWIKIDHSLMPLGHSAPVLSMNKKGVIMVASTWTKEFKDTILFQPVIDTNLRWADIKVVHDTYHLSRHEKIQKILKKNLPYGKYLRTCSNTKYIKRNCGNCPKCLLTITSLILEDIDPNDFNFNIGSNILDKVKDYLMDRSIPRGGVIGQEFFWKDLQNHIPKTIDPNKMYHSAHFFEWLRKYDYSNPKPKNTQKSHSSFSKLITPYRIIKKYYVLARYRGCYYAMNLFYKKILLRHKNR